jgi:hypothetical protein
LSGQKRTFVVTKLLADSAPRGRGGPMSRVFYVDRESKLVVARVAGQSQGDAKPAR